MVERIHINISGSSPIFRYSQAGHDVGLVTDASDYAFWEGGDFFKPDLSGTVTVNDNANSTINFGFTPTVIPFVWMWGRRVSDSTQFKQADYDFWGRWVKGASSMQVYNRTGHDMTCYYFIFLTEFA